MLDDRQLVRKSKQGDLDAFEELVRRYENKVYSIAFRFMGNHADASDIAQEAFIRLYQALPRYREEAGLTTWMYHITANACRDELRKKQRARLIPLNDYITETFEGSNTAKSGTNPEEELERLELQEQVQLCLNKLTDEHRIILILREMQDLSYEEISEVLKCSMGTVKSRLNRARKALREKLLEQMEH
ncbi:MAG TPA: sigma-70 family RNA polymerase sigma factor [Clostridia bacterium]|nr:sigma-70 family RNA polymerase sigma factor [Clostridia bacterium]